MVASPAHKVGHIQTHFELWGKEPAIGYEWDAGTFHVTKSHPSGRITVVLKATGWQVWEITWPPIIHRREGLDKKELLLKQFPIGDDGERAAKEYARELFQEYRRA